jgi:hypothetical protein
LPDVSHEEAAQAPGDPVLVAGERPASLAGEPVEERRFHEGEDGIDGFVVTDLRP